MGAAIGLIVSNQLVGRRVHGKRKLVRLSPGWGSCWNFRVEGRALAVRTLKPRYVITVEPVAPSVLKAALSDWGTTLLSITV